MKNKIFSIVLAAIFFSQLVVNVNVFAAVGSSFPGSDHQTPPTNVDSPASSLTYDASAGKYYAGLKWTLPVPTPNKPTDLNTFNNGSSVNINNGLSESGYYIYSYDTHLGSNTAAKYPINITEQDPVTGTDRNSYQLDKNGSQDLSSGKIYGAYMQAYHMHSTLTPNGTTVLTPHMSVYSNTTYFMTDIAFDVQPAGSNALQIRWDDVWDGSSRIGYEIHISESKTFSKDTTLIVTSSNISATGPVIPASGGKLIYTVKGSFLKDSTVYYVKIKPVITDPNVKYNAVDAENNIKVGYTNIVTSMTKISDGWWQIIWNPVTDSTLQSGQKVVYTIKRGLISASNNAVLEDVAQTTDTKYFLNIVDNTYFYMIVADIKDGFGNRILDQYGYGVKSDKLFGVEGDIATNPTVPDLKSALYLNPADTSSPLYDDSITPWLQSKQATIAWTPPTLADGLTVDTNVLYDIYLVTDSSMIDAATTKPTFANLKTFTQITSNGKILAYTYTFTNLTPNTVYYLKLIAKKTYTVNNNGVLSTQDFPSLPALKVIITPPNGSIDQPVAPAKPPLKIKTVKDDQGVAIPDTNGNATLDVGKNNVWIEWANKWGLDSNGAPIDISDPSSGYDDSMPSFTYDIHTTFNIGYVEYSSTLDYSTLQTLPTQIQNIPNTTTGNAYTILYNLTNLKPNTVYVIWLRAYNPNVGLMSEPSDPLIVVTKPDYTVPIEKPIVPTFNYNNPSDTAVDLQWDENPSYTYYIKYSTTDNIATAQNSVTVKPADLIKSPVYTVTGLTPNTVYYFWIQADSTGNKVADGMSLWSDGYPAKTLAYTPPDTPQGFGIKNTPTAVGKNNLTYEWIQVTGLLYTLEIASDITYKNSTKYSAGAVSEFNVTGLLSNHRYYARLYAVDSTKGNISSLPTQSVTAKTLRSDDDYDANVDTENVITGPFIIYEGTIDGVDTRSVTGSNADRFAEQVQTDKVLDYVIDFTDTTSTGKLLKISNKVLDSLANLKENLILDLGFCKYTIRPGLMNPDLENQLKSKLGDFNLYLSVTTEDLTSSQDPDMSKKGLTYRTHDTTLTVNAVNGSNSIPINAFTKPVQISFKYTPASFYYEGKTVGYYYNDAASDWMQQPTTAKYNQTLDYGYINFYLNGPYKAAVLVSGSASVLYDDISGADRYTQISAIATKYKLKSADSTSFRPNDNITIGEAAKLIMDIMNYNYDENYGATALKARFISSSDLSNIDGECPAITAYQMIDRLYEIKTGNKADSRQYTGEDNQPITRGDFMGELYIMLSKIGEF